MYEICVGEGGMSPSYFARVPLGEALLFAQGVYRRYRESWRQTRFATYVIAAPNYKQLDYKTMLYFPWEEEENILEKRMSEEQEAQAVNRLRKKIPLFQKLIKNG